MMLIVMAAIALPALVLLVAWFAGPPSDLLPPLDEVEQPASNDEVWLMAPWWIV